MASALIKTANKTAINELAYNPYIYPARITDVYDGDTCTAEIDVGFDIVLRERTLRLHRIDTPEVQGEERPEGVKVRDHVRSLILSQDILVETIKDRKGKFGRWLAEIWVQQDGEFVNLNDHLLAQGMAERVDYD